MGRSSSSSASSNSTVVNTNNYALQGDNEGVAIMGNGNTVTTTDHGAINAAFELGKESLSFADMALTGSLAFGENVIGESLGAVSDLTDKHMQSLNDLTLQQAEQNREQIEAIGQLAKNVQTGGQAEIAEASKTMLKGILTAITIVIGLVVIGSLFRSSN
ncbi:hypothetical protein B9J90_13425 [Vibrio sp. V09_P4A23P171]|uniref:hypothetical protein n=1 Tax=Vibrio sp. V09_P4A23P171 TaxID=1938664 RepID=UPI000B8E2DD1|nr:hypothetical protein [Vibrio sp. V09_P4A23P171]OXX34140.1 hypothetical protein B9J90_13425 [Vibrio sp. V09_P4A23P171]